MNLRNLLSVLAPATCLLLIACTDPAAKLSDYGLVPPFEMVDSSGQPFTGAELAGKVWVADFIYTNCAAECPMMSAKMRTVEKKVRGAGDVRLVSISVDPARDTPAALTRFARHFGGPNKQWIFLTGSPATIHTLAYTTFHVGDVLGTISHSTKFILIDKRSHIRGYYSSLGDDDIASMLHDLALLRRQRAVA